jgi:LEA14-like dessication related protein
MNINYNKNLVILVVLGLLVSSCLPKEQVVFKSVKNLVLDGGLDGEPLLKGEAVFFNPNKIQTKLKEINVDILVDGKKAARVDQQMNLVVPGKSEFTVPIQANISLKDFGLLDAVIGFFGGKSYQVQFTGYLRVSVHGIPVKVPVKYNEEVKLK